MLLLTLKNYSMFHYIVFGIVDIAYLVLEYAF